MELPEAEFDLVLLAQRLGPLITDQATTLLERSIRAAKPGGRVVVIDLFRGPAKPNLAECIEALKLDLGTRGGHMRSLDEIQTLLQQLGLRRVQFAFLAASKVNMGMAVGERDAGETG